MTADENGTETPTPAPSGAPGDGTAQAAQEAQGATQSTQETRPQLGIRTQYVKDLSFENPSAPNRPPEAERSPDITVNVQVEVRRLDETTFEVNLQITANARHEEKPVFLVELTYAGVFTLIGIPQEALEPALLVECPRLLFPFARRIVADVTRDGGFPPLLLAPIDFLALYRDGQARARAAQAQAQAAEAQAAEGRRPRSRRSRACLRSMAGPGISPDFSPRHRRVQEERPAPDRILRCEHSIRVRGIDTRSAVGDVENSAGEVHSGQP